MTRTIIEGIIITAIIWGITYAAVLAWEAQLFAAAV